MSQSKLIVTQSLSIMMIVITLLYVFGILVDIPCQSDVISLFLRNFIHVEPLHLLANLYAFSQFSVIESFVGSLQYLGLIMGLSVLQIVIELFVRYYIALNCSIGFSGTLYGLLVWMVISNEHVNIRIIMGILLSIFGSSYVNPHLSLSGHLIGVLSGLIVATIGKLKYMFKWM